MTLSTVLPPRRWSSVRSLLVVMFLTAAVYAGALPVYLLFRIRATAAGLTQGTAAAVPILQDLFRRARVVERSRRAAERAIEHRTTLDPASVQNITGLASWQPSGARARHFPADTALSHAVVRSDSAMAHTAQALVGLVALIDDRRWAQAEAQLGIVDSLAAASDEQALVIGSIGRWNMLARQQAVQAVTTEVLRDTVLWLVLGLFVVWLGLVVIQRRILAPLNALDAGLARVSDGDLNTAVPVRGSDEIARIGVHFNEMTQVLLGRAEEQGRFTAAGQLLADVAHEVGNPLMAIAAHAETRIADVTVPPGQREEMQQILRQAQRATKLLRGLLRFVLSPPHNITTVSLNDVVRGALDIVSYRFGVDEISLAQELDPGSPLARADAVALEQVVVNLLSNAIEALRTMKPPRRLTVQTWISNGKAAFGVADNGPGVAPELLGQLFRPFVSTKGRRGAGLGLYVSRQILRDVGGDLVLDAGSGAGARFVATLPTAEAPQVPAPVPNPVGVTPPPKRLAGMRILLVDDEEAVRRPMAKFLTRRGAEVFEAADGIDALALLERQHVDVILADVRMPRMSGLELFAALEENRPELAARVLFLSGDVSRLNEPGTRPVPRERVLVKPVELAELERRVAEFLAGSRSP